MFIISRSIQTNFGLSSELTFRIRAGLILLDKLLDHRVQFFGLILHDEMSGERDELEVGFGQSPFHFAHFDQTHEPVLQAVDQQGGDGDASVESHVA